MSNFWEDAWSYITELGGGGVPQQPPVDFDRVTVRGGRSMDGTDYGDLTGATGIGGGVGADGPTFMQGLTGYTDANGIKNNGWGGMEHG